MGWIRISVSSRVHVLYVQQSKQNTHLNPFQLTQHPSDQLLICLCTDCVRGNTGGSMQTVFIWRAHRWSSGGSDGSWAAATVITLLLHLSLFFPWSERDSYKYSEPGWREVSGNACPVPHFINPFKLNLFSILFCHHLLSESTNVMASYLYMSAT